MKGTFHKSSAVTALLMSVLCILLGIVFAVNILAAPHCYDADMYLDIRYGAEVWEHKSVFPENWVFGNQVYVAATPVLAGLLCGITNDPPLAMALASSLMAVLVILSFHWMLKPALEERNGCLAADILFLVVVLFFGDASQRVNGWQLLFTMCSYYACYAIAAFMAFGCMLRADQPVSGFWGALVLTCLMAFATGIQSLRQTAVMALPLLAMAFLYVMMQRITKKTIEKTVVVTALSVAVSNILGVFLKGCMNIRQVEIFGETGILTLGEMIRSVPQSILTAYSLFMIDGIAAAIVFRGLILVCAGAAAVIVLKAVKCKNEKALELLIIMVISVMAILAVDVLTQMDVRPIYYFILYPLVAYLAASLYDTVRTIGKTVILILILCFTVFACGKKLPEAWYFMSVEETDIAFEISDYLLENGYTTIYSVGDDIAEDIALASDMEIQAGFWFAEEPFLPVKYLCDPAIYETDAERCSYLFRGAEAAADGEERAKSVGTQLELLQSYPEEDLFLYTAPVKLMEELWLDG